MRRLAASLVILLYPAWSHWVIASGHPGLSLPGLAVLILTALVIRDGHLPRSWPPVLVLIVLGVAGAHDMLSDVSVALYVPPVAVPLFLAIVFGRTLLPGRTPLVALFAEQIMGRREPERAMYMRGVTWFWTLLCSVLALQAALLAVFADPVTWSWFANGINYLIVAAAFAGEYVIRCLRFGIPDKPHEFWTRLVQTDIRRL